MRLYLIRHAPTAETGSRLSGRASGIPLSDEGNAIAADLGAALDDVGFVALYSSPLQRCRETARFVARPHGLRPKIDRSLLEVDYGDWSGRRLSRLRRLAAWRSLLETPSRFVFPGGSESLSQAQQRVVSGVERLAGRHPQDVVGAVTHNDAIRLVLAHYLGMPLDLFHRLHVAPASVSVVELDAGRQPRVPVVNQSVRMVR